MRRIWLLLTICALLLLADTGSSLAAPARQSPQQDEILRRVNNVRAAYGLNAYIYNAALTAAAQDQADYLAATGTYVHTGWGGSTPASRARAAGYVGYVSENVVGGTDLTPAAGVIWWQNSPVHLAGLVSTRYVHAGAGYAFGHGQHFYTLVMGRPTEGNLPPDPTGNTDNSAAPIYVTPIELAPPNEDGGIVHVVQPGQTAWAIAARYDVPLSDILLYNNLPPNHTLHAGDELIIRLGEGQSPPPTATPPYSHIVQEGQTAWTIAAIYGLSLSDLLWYNGLGPAAIIQPGDEIIIRLLPGQSPPPTPTPQRTHIVQEGETAWAIAARYDLALSELLAWNGLSQDDFLHVGDELSIYPPPTATPVLPTATPTSPPAATEGAAAPTFTATPAPAVTLRATAAPTATLSAVSVTEPEAGGGGPLLAVGVGFLVIVGGLVVFGGRRGWL